MKTQDLAKFEDCHSASDQRVVLSLRGREFASYGRDNLAFDFLTLSSYIIASDQRSVELPFDFLILSLRGRAFASYGRGNLAFEFLTLSLRAEGEAIAFTVLPFNGESIEGGLLTSSK